MTEKRLLMVYTLLLSFAFIIELNMVYINVSGKYTEVAQKQQSRSYDIDNGRGVITDCNFDRITDTQRSYKTFVTAYDDDLQQVFNSLTETEKQNFYDNIRFKTNFVAQLVQPVDNRENFITTKRYCNFNIAQHLIGYTDGDGNGVAGIEQVYNDVLKDAGKIRYIQSNINGYGIITDKTMGERVDNSDGTPKFLSLTIDNTIQRLCEGLAKEYIPSGSIVVIESKTGKIKAMASTPFYSANNIAAALKMENSPLVNKSMQAYEPGSVIKPLWAAVLMEQGYNPDKIYECSGVIDVNGHEYHCANDTAHGEVDMERALVVSCNCYFINAKLKDKGFNLYRMAKTLNFGDRLSVATDYNTKSGYFPTTDELNDLGQLSAISFGQGKMLLTPIHVAAYMNMFANDGKYVYPQVVQGIYNADTNALIEQVYQYKIKQVLQKETANSVKSMLKSVAEEGAQGRACPQHLSAGGKTGTAQTGRYNEDGSEIMNAWFCGFYPYDNPRYTICVTICNGGESTRTAAPIFKKICDSLYYLL